MKLFLLSLMLSGASQWLAGSAAKCDDGDAVKKRVVVMKKGGADAADGKVLIVRKGSGDASTKVTVSSDDEDDDKAAGGKKRIVVMKKVGDDEGDNDGRSEERMVTVVAGAGDDDDKNGWLGVSVTEVPEALAAQLDIEGRGLLVQNVVEDSPADKAGLHVHDVVLSIGGRKVEGNVGQLVELVQSHKPGEAVELLVLRDGNKKEIEVTLGTRGSAENTMEWKFEVAPDAEVEDEIHTHGRMLRKDPKGNWVMEDLGDLQALKDLPADIKMYLPKSGSKSVQVFTEGANKKIRTKVQKDGDVLIVEQDGDGDINVSRIGEKGDETKDSYSDAESLRKADPEAYELYENSKGSVHAFAGADDGGADGKGPRWKFDFDRDDWKGHFGDWQKNMEKSLETAKEAHEKAMEELHELLQQWKDGKGFKVDPGQLRFFGDGDHRALPSAGGLANQGKPKHSFQVQADGSIEVRIRRGDSELVRKYADEDDLAKRDPKLYEKYDDLRAAEDDE